MWGSPPITTGMIKSAKQLMRREGIYTEVENCDTKAIFILNLVKSSDLVLHWDISKEIGHRLSMVDPSNCLCKHQTDVYCLDFSALLLVNLLRNCIRHKQLQEKKNQIPLAQVLENAACDA